MEDWHWQLGIWGGATTAWVLGLALLILWLLELRSIRGESNAVRRFTLGALGGMSILAVYAVALQITLVREAFEEVAGGTVLLIDNSRSMTLAGSSGERSDAVRALIRKWQEDDRVEPLVYRFGSDTRGGIWNDLADTYDPTDDETNIREGISAVLEKGAEQELGSVIVITDGADPSFRADTLSLDSSAPAIHSVVIGGDDRLDDQAIVSLRADSTAYVGVPAVIRADVRAVGELRVQELNVQLWHEKRLIQEQLVPLDAEGNASVAFEVTPKRPGRTLYRLTIPVHADDEVPQNNERAALLRVGRDRVRVLLVAGRPSWDVRFLRDFIKRDGSVDLISFFILRAPSDLTAAPTDELALIPFPTDELFREHLGSFDVVIFQNFDFAPYEIQVYLPRIRDYVKRGGSFLMIGGDHSFSLGGYAGTPIEEVLPVKLSAAGSVVTGSYRPQPNRQLIRHPIVALGPDPSLTRRTWQALPPLHGANAIAGVKEGAQVLLEHPRARLPGGGRRPILVVGEADRGRVAAMTTDASWRWRFASDDATVGSDEYELFWDRLVRWLTRDPLLEPARISTDRDRYGIGAPVIVSGLLRDERYRPIANKRVSLRLEPAEDEATGVVSAQTDREGQVRATLPGPNAAGAHEVKVALDGEEIAAEVFLVEESGDELANLEVTSSELEAVAEQTGGRVFLSVDDVPPLSELAATTRKASGLISKQPLLNPLFLFFTVVILAATWVVRRRWGRR
ncbi:MAG: glutamine amidotransferase [Deltaproteobacteria bacterium]|nr:glutamine amidotransferase [Deltaproteobacteria bacterium]